MRAMLSPLWDTSLAWSMAPTSGLPQPRTMSAPMAGGPDGEQSVTAPQEGTSEVTRSLHRTAAEPAGRTMSDAQFGESFEILPKANGVPRSAWLRTRRLSTWHRPYTFVLLVLDYLAVLLADLTAVALLDKAQSGF